MAMKLIDDIDRTGAPTAAPVGAPPPAAAAPTLTRGKRLAVVLVPVLVVGVAWGVVPFALYWAAGPARPGPGPVAAHDEAPNGRALYARHCASCHGAKGDAAGVLAPYVRPRPRDFGEGLYRLKTTATGQPTDDDLMRVVRHGIPGSAMPAFPDLSEAEGRALVAHVRDLTRSGLYARLRQKMEQDGGSADLSELADAVHSLTQVGPVIDVPDRFPAATLESVANGRRLYLAGCAGCHGPEGRGDGPLVAQMKDADGLPARPRDLAAGTFKGGGDPEHLYARILLGMPGTAMPANTQLKPEEIGDLINYVRSLSRPAAPAGDATTAAPAAGRPGAPAGATGGR